MISDSTITNINHSVREALADFRLEEFLMERGRYNLARKLVLLRDEITKEAA